MSGILPTSSQKSGGFSSLDDGKETKNQNAPKQQKTSYPAKNVHELLPD